MILLIQNRQDYNNDLRAMLMAFFPGVRIVEQGDMSDTYDAVLRVEYGDAYTMLTVCRQGHMCDNPDDLNPVKELPVYADTLDISSCGYRARIKEDYRNKKVFRNIIKMAVYRLLGQYTDRRLPWGDLTGVRPTKIAMAGLSAASGQDNLHAELVGHYVNYYDVSPCKAELAASVAEREKELVDAIDTKRAYCLYIGIPFCPSRCLYCSFTSYPIGLYEDRACIYIDRLCEELDYIADAYRDRRLISIYIGGGTPTSITAVLLDRLLTHIDTAFGLGNADTRKKLLEFTIEAGRPDSITMEKLDTMKKHGVTRISINPQTMNDATLRLIGRAHTAKQTETAFYMARQAGFDNINMDLIAGLPGESMDDMRHTLHSVKQLAPESITVHSLAIKRASRLRQELAEYGTAINHDMDTMHEAAAQTASELGMKPYYLYRQKNIGGNLENVGYAIPGLECLYNILIMEEMTDIIAAGAGGSTKLVYHNENRVERVENCKSVDDYIDRFKEMLARKDAFIV